MATSPSKEVKAPLHFKTPRSYGSRSPWLLLFRTASFSGHLPRASSWRRRPRGTCHWGRSRGRRLGLCVTARRGRCGDGVAAMASAAAPRRVDGASTAQPGRRAAAARRRRGPPSRQRSGTQRTGAQLHLDNTVPRRSVHPSKALQAKAPVRFRTRAATSAGLRCSRRKAAGRRQCQRHQART